MKKSPFKFLDSFTLADRDVFFGRNQEITELYRKVFESKMLLVYGISGTGKSSLINCGLASRFDESDWLPLNVRRGGNIIDSLNEAINKQAIRPLNKNRSVPEKLQSVYLDHFKPVFLIFDQFEELFIFGDKEERKSFVQIIKSLIESELQCRLVFVMREEYMAGVTEFERYIPTFFANRVRIEKMSHINALEAIKEPCKVFNINLEEGFTETLLEKLSPGSTEVELTYLQVFLDKIFHLAQSEKGVTKGSDQLSFTLRLLEKTGDVTDLLGSFLEDQIKELDEPDTGLTILKSFVSIKGTKKQLTQEEVIKSSKSLGKNISDETIIMYLQKFVNLRILREKDENNKYELRHDSLATKIYEKITVVEKEMIEIHQFLENAYSASEKRKVLLNANDLKYIAPYEDRLFVNKEIGDLIEQSKNELDKAKKRIKRVAISGFIAILIFSIGVIFRVYHFPFSTQLRDLGLIIYVLWFLPVFGYYAFKTKENRTINFLFLIFTLLFVANIFLLIISSNSRMRITLRSSIRNEEVLERNREKIDFKTKSYYDSINNMSERYNSVVGNYKEIANNLKERTDELVNYIQDLKIEIIKTVDGPASPAINGREIDVSKINKFDDANMPSQILIGANENGKAFALKALIHSYKTTLGEIVKYDPDIIKNIDIALNLDDHKEMSRPGGNTEVKERWENYTFQTLPVVFVIIRLIQMQNDVKNLESDVLSFLQNKMNAKLKLTK